MEEYFYPGNEKIMNGEQAGVQRKLEQLAWLAVVGPPKLRAAAGQHALVHHEWDVQKFYRLEWWWYS